MTISEVKRRARIAEWTQNFRNQQDSGLTVKGWCEAHGFTVDRYYYWLRVVRKTAIESMEQAAPGAALIKIEPERLPSSMPVSSMERANKQPGITMRYGKTSVEFPAGTPATMIAEMLMMLNAND